MSGRPGTIKAGTYGGRRFRQKQKESVAQQRELAKEIKKETRERAPSTKQIRDIGSIAPARLPQRGEVLRAPLGRGGLGFADAQYRDEDAEEIPLVGKKPMVAYSQGRDERAREIQRVVNTMPLVQDSRYLNLIRREVEQRNRVMYNPDVEFEDFAEQDDIEEEQAVEAGQVDEETGEVEYGTAIPDNFGEVDALDIDPFLEDVEDDPETDTDEEAEAFGRALDKAGEQRNLKEEIERRREARRQRNLSVPGGERAPGGIFIRGLAPVEKMPTKYPIEQYKRKKATKKEGGGTKLDVGAKGNLKPTDEYIALQEGRILDRRLGMPGRDIETGTRSRVKLATEKQPKREYDLGMGVKRDPKTRKVLTDKKGNPKMEAKKLTIAPRQKAVEEFWGVDRKGMSREEDNPPTRDPYEGRRAIAKEPGKRATKAREAETKHKLYVKTQREKDPNYIPRGFDPFSYGAGASVYDKKSNPNAVLKTEGARLYEPDAVGLSSNDVMISGGKIADTTPNQGDDISEAEFKALQSYERIQDPPMMNAQSQGVWTPEPPMNMTGSQVLPPGVAVSDAQILRNAFREMGQEPDEEFIRQQVSMVR